MFCNKDIKPSTVVMILLHLQEAPILVGSTLKRSKVLNQIHMNHASVLDCFLSDLFNWYLRSVNSPELMDGNPAAFCPISTY